jgi:hypothetical protein
MYTQALDLAFNLLDEAADRLGHQQYGITDIAVHNHGPVALTTVHHYTPETGHRLVLLADDDYGLIAAIEAAAPDLETTPMTRIQKVQVDELTFHAVPGTWSYRATAAGHSYTLTAGVGDEPMWTVSIDRAAPVSYTDLDDAVATILTHHTPIHAA